MNSASLTPAKLLAKPTAEFTVKTAFGKMSGVIAQRVALVLVVLNIAACSLPPGSGGAGNPGDQAIEGIRVEGGVDVGNMQSALVPTTNASISFPRSWSSAADSNVLSVRNGSGSFVEAKPSDIKDLASPSARSLQKYLQGKHPERKYEIVSLNGLEGVRSDILNTKMRKQSELYLVSEYKDFIHIRTDLKKENDGITEGEQIVLTVRLKYRGVAYPNAQKKTVKLESRQVSSIDRHAYAFAGDCFLYSDKGCNPSGGVAVSYEGQFNIGTAGYDHGRIVELGSEAEIPFDSIRIEGEYLVAPQTKVSLVDIYSVFTPKTLQKDQSRIDLKAGHVYLVRTIRWPDEDLITKMRVEKVEKGLTVVLTYEKLVFVEEEDLQAQVKAINEYTLKHEAPLSTGEVVLFNRSVWNSYPYSAFNFQYSTSGNVFLTRNGWDLMVDQGCMGKPTFDVPHAGSALGAVSNLGSKALEDVTPADLPDPNSYSQSCGVEIVKGQTYGIYHHIYSGEVGTIHGAVRVLDMGPNGEWVRLKFRRIHVGPPVRFQKWTELEIPQGQSSVTLERTSDRYAMRFYPFLNQRGDGGEHHEENIDFDEGKLYVDSRPYGKDRGFYSLGKNVDLDKVTLAQVDALQGKFDQRIQPEPGDVIAVRLENYFDKTVLVMRVDSLAPDQSIRFAIKYLQRAKAPYSTATK